MISSSRLLLREWRESDLIFLMNLRNNVSLQAKLLANAQGSNLSQVKSWLEKRVKNSQQKFFVIESQKKQPVGYIQTELVEKSPKTFQIGICISEAFQGIGFGQETLSLIENFLYLQCGADKILLYVDVKNHTAINCYLKLNFRVVGVLTRYKKIGDFWCDVLTMEKLRPSTSS